MTGNLTFDGTNRSVALLATNIQGINNFIIGTNLSTCNIKFNMAISPCVYLQLMISNLMLVIATLLGHWSKDILNVLN